MIESITFDTAGGRIIVLLSDGSERQYTERVSYVFDFPEREADCDAMGWA